MNSRVAPVGHLLPDQLSEVVTAAGWAPSTNGSRPWRFQITDVGIELHIELPPPVAGDAVQRQALVACGAALFNLRMAIRSHGVDCMVRLLPDDERPDLLAVVEVLGQRPMTPQLRDLTTAMPLLNTEPHQFGAGTVSEALLNELRHSARIEQAWVATISSNQLAELIPLVAVADRSQLSGGSPLIAAIGTFQDDRASRLRAGQAVQRVLLTATRWRLNACFLNLVSDLPTARHQLRQLMGGGLWPQALLRVGVSAA